MNRNAHKIILDCELKMELQIISERIDLVLIDKNKINCQQQDFAVQLDHEFHMKENEKIYHDVARGL